jgi:outer membrane immunogenic protein
MRIINFLKTKAILPVAIVCTTFLALLTFSPDASAQRTSGEGAIPAVQKTNTIPTDATWSGFYLGAHAGSAWNNYDVSSFNERVDVIAQFYQELGGGAEGVVESGFSDFSLPGNNGGANARPSGGFQAGYNMQFGHFVVGFESNVSFTSANQAGHANDFAQKFFTVSFTNDTEANTTLSTIRRAEMNWNVATELHLGYAWHQFLFYILGGGAYAGVTVSTQDRASTDFFFVGETGGGIVPQQGGRFLGNVTNSLARESSQFMAGYTAGAGVGLALTEFVSVNLEYRHSNYGDNNFDFKSSTFIVPGSNNVAVDSDQVLLKVNLLLGHL